MEAIAPSPYVFCGASATTTLGATGALGDILRRVVVIPTATAAVGTVSIKDGSGTAIVIYNGGTLADQKPTEIELQTLSRTGVGQWSIICGANVTALVTGKFSN
jgi:hypothetical protein